jgi:hypothetical protein
VAADVGCSQALISRIEAGRGDRLSGRTLERVTQALGARLIVRLDWNGEALDRLLDRDHAALVDLVIRALRDAGWEALPEATFAIAGERGSVDVLAWHPASRTLLVVEVKSVVPDIQAMVAALDRKVRLAPAIARAYGWQPLTVARLLVVGNSRTARRRVEAHAATFQARFPDRNVAVRRFVASPVGRSLSGLWFVTAMTQPNARHRAGRRMSAPHA